MSELLESTWEAPGRIGSWIQTAAGIAFFPLDPRPDEILISDIAHHLSQLRRWTGASSHPINIAQHSVNVAIVLEKWGEGRKGQLRGLLHDGSEAYLNDISRPVKRMHFMREYRTAEENLQNAIYTKYGVSYNDLAVSDYAIANDLLHKADAYVLGAEAMMVMVPITHPENWKWATDLINVSDRVFSPSNPYDKLNLTETDWRVSKTEFLNKFTELI